MLTYFRQQRIHSGLDTSLGCLPGEVLFKQLRGVAQQVMLQRCGTALEQMRLMGELRQIPLRQRTRQT